MRSITVLWDGTNYTRAWLEPLVWARQELYDRGFEIHFFSREEYTKRGTILEIPFGIKEARDNEFDIVFCVYHDAGGDIINHKKQIEILQELKRRCNYLVWFDTADSSGDTNFQLIPYVDRYMKQQLLRDKKQYLKPIYGSRLYCDYYHNVIGIPDNSYGNPVPAVNNLEWLNKVGISWNFCLGKPPYEIEIVKPDINRTIDVYYRGTSFDCITHVQRKMIIDRIKLIHDMTVVNPEEKVQKLVYDSEMRDSRSVISPFGWGELCYRDAETFVVGAALIKPDVSHFDTYPDCFIANETYICLNWDFSNFDEIMDSILNKQKTMEIAIAGQERYIKFARTEDSKRLFANHVIDECLL